MRPTEKGITTMKATTLRETAHGDAGQRLILPAGVTVNVKPASNLPDDSKIKWWASPCSVVGWSTDLVDWAEGPGVGLYEEDVRLNED